MRDRRNASTKAGVVLGVISALILLTGCRASANSGDVATSDAYHQSYPLAAGGQIDLSNINGNVTIVASDTNEVKVDAVKHGDPADMKEVQIKVAANPSSIHIQTEYPKRTSFFGHGNNISVEYTLTVPRSARLDKINLVNGKVSITGVAGDVRASVVNGSVQAREATGSLDLSSVNGGVEANLQSPARAVRLHSVNGSVVLIAPSDLQGEITASTVNGHISNDFGLQVNKGQFVGANLNARLGTGTTRIELNTVNGAIDLRHAADGKPLSNAGEAPKEKEEDAHDGREPL